MDISCLHSWEGEHCSRLYSRSLSNNTEWQLAPIISKSIVHTLNFVAELDRFASSLNALVPCYASWFPDPNAVANDAFSLSWENEKFYSFPPFSLIGATLAKIWKEQSTGFMIFPWWETQFWFPLMLQLLTDFPI